MTDQLTKIQELLLLPDNALGLMLLHDFRETNPVQWNLLEEGRRYKLWFISSLGQRILGWRVAFKAVIGDYTYVTGGHRILSGLVVFIEPL